jgi:hypothetical protein
MSGRRQECWRQKAGILETEGWHIGDRRLAFAFIAVGRENNGLLVIKNEYVRTANV